MKKTFFRFARLENSQKKWNCSKGSPGSSIYQKIPGNSWNFGGKCLSVNNVFHLTHSFHSFPGSLHHLMYFPPKYKIAVQLLLLNEMLVFSRSPWKKRVSLIQMMMTFTILAAVATYMRLDLHRNKGFYENILPAYTIDESIKKPLQDDSRDLWSSVLRSTSHRKSS